MIETIVLYIVIGCIIALITCILDFLNPSNRFPLTGKILLYTVILWPYILVIWIKTTIKVIRREHNDKS